MGLYSTEENVVAVLLICLVAIRWDSNPAPHPGA